MEIQKTIEKDAYAIKITARESGVDVGRVFVYILSNELHDQPFGLIEDLYVDDSYRGKGLGTTLLTEAIEVAKGERCYKLLCTSRHERAQLHEWYQKHGLNNHGLAFRMDIETE